jgi:DNA-binding transcriptional MerR regulator
MADERVDTGVADSTEGWTLAELVRRAQLALGDVAAPNGRVTAMPDARVIRWYATIGLIDRPLAGPGRVARYGPRHLRQLVAVKRRQAMGRSLAEIQAELTGIPDAVLDPIAQVSAALLAHGITQDDVERTSERRATFWADRYPRGPRMEIAAPLDRAEPLALHGVRLGEAVLLLPHPVDSDDLAAIHSVAQPLLELLAERGLLTPPGRSTERSWTS